MSRFVARWVAGVFVIGSVLAKMPAVAVEAPSTSARSSVCSADAGSLPVSKARLLAFGSYRSPEASLNAEAQRFFDQGLVFGWGFSFAEAVRSFRAAAAAPAEVEQQGTRQHFLAAPVLTQVRLYRWSSRRKDVEDAAALGSYLRGLTHFAQGMGYAARGDVDAARGELELLQRSWRDAQTAGFTIKNINRSSDVLAVARWQLQSAIASARELHRDAVRFARAAVAAEDRLAADDPPVWPLPARHTLGNALLSAHRAAEARKVFSDDLRKYPRNCGALAGLAAAERAQRSSSRASLESAQPSAHLTHCPK